MTAEPIRVLLSVVRRLDGLGLTYAVGGSLSSSVFGEPRASADVDILVAIAPRQAHAVAAAFADEFYVDEGAVTDAARRETSFNVIHLGTMLKADEFVASDDLLDREQLRRKVLVTVERHPPQTAFITGAGEYRSSKARLVPARGRRIRSAMARHPRRHEGAGLDVGY